MNLFDLIPTKIGEFETYARPFDFEFNDKGEPIVVKKAATTCDKCGSYIEIDCNIDKEGMTLIAVCSECGAGSDYILESNDDKVKLKVEPEVKEQSGGIKSIKNSNKLVKSDPGIKLVKSDPGIKAIKGSVVIDENNEVAGLKTGCAFVDPIDLGKFKIDEL